MPSQPPVISRFGQALSNEMRRQKISAEFLARETGISVRLIRKYKRGQTIPQDYYGEPTENAQKLARVLSLNLDELFESDEVAA